MKIYTLHKKQLLPIGLDKAWEFLSNPRNLKIITPESMSFDIISGAEKPMFAGQIIQYLVTPIFGIKTKWVSEITQLKPKEYFVDIQLYGPYALWHHKHFVHEIEGGVELEDIIDYKVPLGFLGQLVHPFLVKPKLEEIFNYRQKKLLELFGEYQTNDTKN
ncbi:MAG: SRPBCC family protein [Flavobacteriia bacterium]|nr:SRPBCC family protein [Flavobacteriia bacterium]OIP46210.1 MAG: cell division inhibitor [Flavobacteriaceae bacterium CG2_30_31_66]PIV96843.1 MAG: cell division inhibitor [Flavobacteriaceae bacterium CG17_big_fil_post_rev_8_21_14_2_50_31_13]PIX14684.1 MAG: cell division inhibitor [Flavobacteriaceae bacterium CG_4_8_14_3_um_filter_31_8]PIY15695.1 MAG: cell division inhibitor [Flavobacteriaceae bacterium CG_4_10_14_3_um_filter_31_253]PIZ09536.1 MAG: cell division inhibitor [Flavobacteriaceae b